MTASVLVIGSDNQLQVKIQMYLYLNIMYLRSKYKKINPTLQTKFQNTERCKVI